MDEAVWESDVSAKKMRWLPLAILGILAICLITSITLIATVRDKVVVVAPGSSTSPTPAPTPPFPNVKLSTITSQFNHIFPQGSVDVSPVTSVVIESSATPSNVSPSIPQNMLPPNLTFAKPLQQTPQSLGFPCMTQNGTQLLTSMQNGEQSFGQFQQSLDDLKYSFLTEAYQVGTDPDAISNSNRIVKTGEGGALVINDSASGLGCVGVRSIVLSTDDLRLYVAFRDSTMSNDNIFPFDQVAGKVQVWRRDSADAQNWQHMTNADMQNPFTTQVGGLNVDAPFNAFLDINLLGDDFGSYMITANTYEIAIACQMGALDTGRNICVFQEENDFSYKPNAILVLPGDEKSVSSADRQSFATAFAFSGDGKTCVASLGSHDTPSARRLAWFLKGGDGVSATAARWEFQDFIDRPVSNADEIFGTSMVLNPDGTVCIVGSPTAPVDSSTIPFNGHVYIYTRSATTWTLIESISDPFATSSPAPNTRTFGWFVNTDRNFRVLTVSANQDSLYYPTFHMMQPPAHTCSFSLTSPNAPCTYTNFVVFSILQETSSLDLSTVQRVYQDLVATDFIDPLFGARVDIAETSTGVLFLAGSPLNQKMTLFTMAPT